MVACTVLDRDDLDIGVFGFDPVDEPVAALDAGAAGLVMDDKRDLPYPPINSAILSAASAAAAMLLVAAVVTGMSLSTPERSDEGMLASFAEAVIKPLRTGVYKHR